MKEALIHFLWKNALVNKREFLSDTGEQIYIVHFGTHNTDAGPDFTDAKIDINGTLWAGNIEIHLKGSDWYRHGHHTDSAYNNVILHVVLEADKPCQNEAGRTIPTIVLKPHSSVIEKYQKLMQSPEEIACVNDLHALDPLIVHSCLSSLTVERLSLKAERVEHLLSKGKNNWEEAFYQHLARSFGSKLNALPFEMLAKSLPLKILLQQPDDLPRAEALLFGQAGFLTDHAPDDYYESLQSEYQYYKKKNKLVPLGKHLWKFLRARPHNFPTIRIAQFANLITRKQAGFSNILDCTELSEVVEYFSGEVSDYWKNHYTFGKVSAFSEKHLGKGTINSLIINTVVPFIFVFGQYKNRDILKVRAVNWLEQIPAEKNEYTRSWHRLGIIAQHAADSQAMIRLTEGYCKPKECLKCKIGTQVLKA